MDNNFESRLQAIEYELSQVVESEYLDELRKKFTADEDIGIVVNIITPKNIVFKTRSLLSQILNRLELTHQDRLDLEKYIIYGGGDNIEYLKQTLAIWKDAVEVKQNGDVYIKGIGGFTGSNSDSSKSVQEVINELANKLNEITTND